MFVIVVLQQVVFDIRLDTLLRQMAHFFLQNRFKFVKVEISIALTGDHVISVYKIFGFAFSVIDHYVIDSIRNRV